jgi:hypothetical protein
MHKTLCFVHRTKEKKKKCLGAQDGNKNNQEGKHSSKVFKVMFDD